MTLQLPRILCVDDEPNILEGLSLNLRRHGRVVMAQSGVEALALLEQPDFEAPAVIISDMRMPPMDGATFLSRARLAAPEAVRLLLTGQADTASAIAAINEGHVFRFLTKPCPQPVLFAAVDAAVAHHNLIVAERVLLAETLHGSVTALVEVLALTSPLSFGRAARMKELVSAIADTIGMKERWHVEVAAMLSQLGAVSLPADVAEKHYYGRALTPEEQAMVARVPAVTEKFISAIPRLDIVSAMLRQCPRPYRDDATDATQRTILRGAHLLRVALDFDVLLTAGADATLAINTMRGRAGQYDRQLLNTLAELRSSGDTRAVREVPLRGLQVGMVLLDDAKLAAGAVLVPKGYVVTQSFLERCRNFQAGLVVEPLRVALPAWDTGSTGEPRRGGRG